MNLPFGIKWSEQVVANLSGGGGGDGGGRDTFLRILQEFAVVVE